MSAGDSARAEADRAGTAAERMRRELEALAERARRFGQGAAGESRTAQLLGPLKRSWVQWKASSPGSACCGESF